MFVTKMEEDNCAVCLIKNGAKTLESIDGDCKDDVNITMKLSECVPEIEWRCDFLLCGPCLGDLECAYRFRMMCLRSETIRRQPQLVNVRSDNADAFDLDETVDDKPVLVDDIKKEDIVVSEDLCEVNNDPDDSPPPTPPDCSLKEAVKRCPVQTDFSCDDCGEVFKSKKLYVGHVTERHDVDVKDIKPFKCSMCDSRFAQSHYLRQHLQYHSGDRTYVCSFCGKGYKTKNDLNVHEKQHLNKREYKCPGCPKHFNTHKDLRTHKLVVHTDRSLWAHQCEFCGRRFPIKSNYLRHMRGHTGERPFACHLCDKRFGDKVVLQKHYRSHTNVRAFKCGHCDKEYKSDQSLHLHLMKVHGIGNAKIPKKEKKFVCEVCSKAYFDNRKLTRHMYVHSGERPFGCEVCEKRFTDKSYVKQHMQKTHNVEVPEEKID